MGKPINTLAKMSTFGAVDLGLDPKTPKLPKPTEAPDPNDPEVKKAEMRRLQRRKRTGRTSTVLSGGGSNSLG